MVHSRFSPSATPREFDCPASFLLAEQVGRGGSNDAADEGTVAHHLAEVCLKYNMDADIYNGWWAHINEKGKVLTAKEERPEARFNIKIDAVFTRPVQEYMDYCRSLGGKHLIERRVEHTRWCPDADEHGKPLPPQFGTADFLAFDGGTMYVVDLKFGRGVAVEAVENKQLIKYALGALHEYGFLYDVENVVIAVHQPRIDGLKTWELTADELLEWGDKIKARLDLVFAKEPVFGASEKACKFCPVLPTCREAEKYAHEALRGVFDNEAALLTSEELYAVWKRRKAHDKFHDAVEAELHSRIQNGERICDLGLKRGRSLRAWKDEQAIAEYLAAEGFKDDDIYKRKIQSPNQLEAITNQDLSDYWHKPEGKLKLAIVDPIKETGFESETESAGSDKL